MRHLLIYEAFKSKTISAITKFLSKNMKKDDIDSFLSEMVKIGNSYDLTISEVSDEDISYLNYKKAIEIKKPEDWKGTEGEVYAIKFWFSLEDGYLGKTAIGNPTSIRSSRNQYGENEIFYTRRNRPHKGRTWY